MTGTSLRLSESSDTGSKKEVQSPELLRIYRSQADLAATTIRQAQQAEKKRVRRFFQAKTSKEKADLERRFGAERKLDAEKIQRLLEDGKVLVNAVAQGQKLPTPESRPPVSNFERQTRLKHADRKMTYDVNTMSFISEMNAKLENPNFKKPLRNLHKTIPEKHSINLGQTRPPLNFYLERKDLLNQKKELLKAMHGLVMEEERILRQRGGSDSSRRNWDTRSNVSAALTTYSFRTNTSSKSRGSIATFCGKEEEKSTSSSFQRPSIVPKLTFKRT